MSQIISEIEKNYTALANDILVTIVIPTYNQRETFIKCIESAIQQDYANIEILVIDDNTCKETSNFVQNVVSQLSDQRIKYYKNESNIGSSKSRNKGASLACGDYITFLDDDDYYTVDKVRSQISNMKKHDSHFSVCDFVIFNDKRVIEIRSRNYIKKENPISDTIYLLKKHLMHHITCTSTMMFKREFFNIIGGFSIDDLGDEFYLIQKAIEQYGVFSHINQIGVYAKLNTISGLSSYKNKLLTESKLIKYKKIFFSELTFWEKKYILMRLYLVFAYAYKKGSKYIHMLFFVFLSFFISPIGFIRIVFNLDK
jgi:glycosyltransferase involved in cell wall biosynthesis